MFDNDDGTARKLSPNTIRLISVAAFMFIWEIYGRQMNPILMSYPTAIAVAFYEMLVSGELFDALLSSLQAFMVGFIVSIVLGVIVGTLMGAYRSFEYAIDPFINALYATPNVALIPLLIMWVGLGFTAKASIVFLVAFFPIAVTTYSGVKNISGSLVEIGRAYGASQGQTFQKIILPGAIPFIITGVRLAVGRGVVGIVVAEFFTAINGLGGLIIKFSNQFETAKLFVPIIILAVMGVLLTESVKFFERKLAPWKETERA